MRFVRLLWTGNRSAAGVLVLTASTIFNLVSRAKESLATNPRHFYYAPSSPGEGQVPAVAIGDSTHGEPPMKGMLDKVADHLLSLLGLGLDFSVALREVFFSPITPTLYLGARPGRARAEEPKRAGVTHVVSCLQEDDRSQMAFLEKDFSHLFLGVHDGMQQDIAGKFPQFFDFAEAATADDPKARLFVHCEVGVSRSATLVIALLMKRESMSFFDALCRVRSRRVQILPNIGFASQLQRLEHELQPQSMNSVPSSLAHYLHGVCNAPVEIEILQSALERHRYDAPAALRMIFGDEIPRVIQGVRS